MQEESETENYVEEKANEQEYYQDKLKDGHRGILGAILGTLVAELVLWIGKVDGNPPLIFAVIGFFLAARCYIQAQQAKQQLKELMDKEQNNL